MTNKRKHHLERMVRINYRHFNRMIYPKDFGIELLEQITELVFDSIWLLHYRGNTTLSETHFMLSCVRRYYSYYRILIDKNFG